jgi:hypothetical protein
MKTQDESAKLEGDSADAFMLKEFETLLILRQDYVRLGDNRFNFFLLILSGSVGFLTWLNSNQPQNINVAVIRFLTLTVWLGILALGLTTMFRLIRRNVKISEYNYRMSCIRKYFMKIYPDVKTFIIDKNVKKDAPEFTQIKLQDIRDNFSRLFSQELPIMLAIINGLVFSAGLSVIFLSIFGLRVILSLVSLFFLLVFSYWIQIHIFNKQMRKAENAFPNDNRK